MMNDPTTGRTTEVDRHLLAAAVDLTLELLDVAEQRQSFPGYGREPEDLDAENEQYKRERITDERRRYKELRARLDVDEAHGVPVARDCLEGALGLTPTVFSDNDAEELYERWLEAQRAIGST